MKNLKIAVIGAGHLGRIHARLLTEMPEVDLVGIADPLPTARDKVAADCHTTPYADYRALLDRAEAAVIATPTRQHHRVALDFLRHGISVLVEKPLAANVAECDELVDQAHRHGAMLQVGHIERFNPAFQAAVPHLGLPQYVEAVRCGGFTGRSTDVGVVYDLMIHDIDLLLSLVDSPLTNVSALGLAVLGRHEDVAQARLEFANGCVANLSASRVSPAPAPRRQMQIWSASAFASIDFNTRAVQLVRPNAEVLGRQIDFDSLPAEERARVKDRLTSEILRAETLAVEPRNALADELRDFVDSLRRHRQPRVDGQQARRAVSVAEAILSGIAAHSWHGPQARLAGPLATPAPPILRGPHWATHQAPRPLRREAG